VTQPKVAMLDHAWVWYDYENETYIVECHLCNHTWATGPELYDGSDTGQVAHWWAVMAANLHNANRHGGSP
jgi:hypothetical protein